MVNNKEKGIHWFPGHMKKAQNEIEEKLKIIDIVIEVLDARSPYSSRNIFLKNISKNKPHLIILNKLDLAIKKDKDLTALKVNGNDEIIYLEANNPNSFKVICDAITKYSAKKNEKYLAKGMKPQPIKAMIFGIPNVGKSSIINLLAKHKKAGVANTPGFTKSQQWINVDDKFLLLDTPGILPSKYENEQIAVNLALIGSIKMDILPTSTLFEYLMNIIKKDYLKEFNECYSFNFLNTSSNEEIIESIGRKFGFIMKNNIVNVEQAQNLILRDFKNGKISKIYLD